MTTDKKYSRKKAYTTGDVARLVNVAPRTVSKWFDSGRLKGFRMPGSQDRRVPHEELCKFLRANGLPLRWIGEEHYKILFVGMSPIGVTAQHEALADVPNLKFDDVSSALKAAAYQSQFNPDMVVIDFHIGRTLAVELATQFKTQHQLGSPLILVGLCFEDERQIDTLKADLFTEIFQQPYNPATLAEFIRSHAAPAEDDEPTAPAHTGRKTNLPRLTGAAK